MQLWFGGRYGVSRGLFLSFVPFFFLDARRYLDGGIGLLTFWAVFLGSGYGTCSDLTFLCLVGGWDTAPVVSPCLIYSRGRRDREIEEGEEGWLGWEDSPCVSTYIWRETAFLLVVRGFAVGECKSVTNIMRL